MHGDSGDESLLSSVSGNRFVKTYWSHFPRSLTKGLGQCFTYSVQLTFSFMHFRSHVGLQRDLGYVFSDLQRSASLRANVVTPTTGVVKGSEATLGTKEGRLTRTVYTSLSARSYPTFASQRDNLYSLFEAYVRLTRNRGECDPADR